MNSKRKIVKGRKLSRKNRNKKYGAGGDDNSQCLSKTQPYVTYGGILGTFSKIYKSQNTNFGNLVWTYFTQGGSKGILRDEQILPNSLYQIYKILLDYLDPIKYNPNFITNTRRDPTPNPTTIIGQATIISNDEQTDSNPNTIASDEQNQQMENMLYNINTLIDLQNQSAYFSIDNIELYRKEVYKFHVKFIKNEFIKILELFRTYNNFDNKKIYGGDSIRENLAYLAKGVARGYHALPKLYSSKKAEDVQPNDDINDPYSFLNRFAEHFYNTSKELIVLFYSSESLTFLQKIAKAPEFPTYITLLQDMYGVFTNKLFFFNDGSFRQYIQNIGVLKKEVQIDWSHVIEIQKDNHTTENHLKGVLTFFLGQEIQNYIKYYPLNVSSETNIS